MDGLVGPIVIHGKDDKMNQKIPYSSDRVVLLQDWYYDLSSGLLKEKLSPGSESVPVPNTALINGAGKANCTLNTSRRCDSALASPAVLDLQANQNHRLRLINVGSVAWFEVSVDKHMTLPVTEVDGTDVEHSAPDNIIMIAPGQRHSVVLSANITGSDAFWFRARMAKHCFSGENALPEDGFNEEAKAAVRYIHPGHTPNDSVLPTTEKDSGKYTVECLDMKPGTFKPVPARQAPAHAHHSWYVRVNIEIGDWRLERGRLNTSSFRPNLKSPSLYRVIDGLAAGNSSYDIEGVNTRAFDGKTEFVIGHSGPEVVDVILQNFDEGNHPFHLHGHQMFVLASGHGYFPGYKKLGLAEDGKGLLDPSNSTVVDNPLRRDVAAVEGFGWLLIRFVADNPGIWLFHCHMIWHGESGMAMQFLSRLDMLKNWTIPQHNRALCDVPVEELEKGAAPKDSIWYGFPGGT
jgi:FtsP/CotA-like multicopper oxidase with cupredoxin domain